MVSPDPNFDDSTLDPTPQPGADRGAPSESPEFIGRYRVRALLGKGAMGAVYLAQDTTLLRDVAIKVLHLKVSENKVYAQRFMFEARALARIDHPNLCTILDFGETEGRTYLVMPFIPGRPLSELLRERAPWPEKKAAALVRKIARAIAVLHQRDIVHRDLKPSNILIKPSNEPVVTDFGLARTLSGGQEGRLTLEGAPIGTPAYMPPEQVTGDSNAVGPCSDIYSLGVILYQMLTGRVPYEGSVAAIVGRILFENPQPPSALRPGLEPQLEAACLKAMARKPQDRFATMMDFAAALEGYLRHMSPPQAAPCLPSQAKHRYQVKRRLPWLHAWLLIVLLATAAGLLATLWGTFRPAAAAELYSQAEQLMMSPNPDDQAKALKGPIREYLARYGDRDDAQTKKLRQWAAEAEAKEPKELPDPFSGGRHLREVILWVEITVSGVAGFVVVILLARRILLSGRHLLATVRAALRKFKGCFHRPPNALPPTVGGYRIIRRIGHGGTAEIYLGEHAVLKSPAAIKVFRLKGDIPPTRLRRALREASLSARLQHPHVVTVFNAGQETGFFYVAMKYIPGGDLAHLVADHGPLALPQALAVARNVADALQHVHRHGLVHRDVKPSNILLAEDGTALLSDFGSVKELAGDEASRLTADGEIVGTPAYLAPEQALGQSITPATDLYGFGCLLFFMVTGRDVFSGVPLAAIAQHLHAPPPAPSTLRADLPAELERLILHLLEKGPRSRPADMAEVRWRLDVVAGEMAAVPPRPAAPADLSAFITLAGLPPVVQFGDETLFGQRVFAVGLGESSPYQTIVPSVPAPGGRCDAKDIRLATATGPPDPATEALSKWQELVKRDTAGAEHFWRNLPEHLRAAPSLAAAREWYTQLQADRLYTEALDRRRQGHVADATRLLREALELVPGHREAIPLLRELEAAPAPPLDRLKALAKAGKLQGVPALEALLRQHLDERQLANYLRSQPECAVYKDTCNLQEFLFEEGGQTRERILGDMFGLPQLDQIAREVGEAAPPGTGKEELIQRILAAIGFRRLVLPEGLPSLLREVRVLSRDLDRERDEVRLRGVGSKTFILLERALKDLVHFYGHWLHGTGYPDYLRQRGWVSAYAKAVQTLPLGSLNQAFVGLVREASERPDYHTLLAPGADPLPESWVKSLRDLEPHRNRVFSHDAPETRSLKAQELRAVTVQAYRVTEGLFLHLHSAGVFPRKLVLDRTVQDRHGHISYFCFGDDNEEIEVITSERLELGSVYLCLSATNPKYLNPILVPALR